jgi:phenylpyruvate tautomerase PptA (4-oxalocrotonate tautomerase family)
MPHVNIKYIPVELSDEQRAALTAAVTSAVRNAFGCPEDVVSIALQPVARDAWHESVYVPEIAGRADELLKSPNY